MQLLEREPLLNQLEEHLRQAADGHGRVVLVGGEAGVGKTALVDEFCRAGGRSGDRLAYVVRRALHAGSPRSRP
jgi:KaiC/GvpD/RAD55 family RecA-like ATPase